MPSTENLRDQSIYPGHPIVLALCIMREFSSLKEAKSPSPKTGHPQALTSAKVPGAGGNVWGALDLLTVAEVLSPEGTWEHGEALWLRMVGPGRGNHENTFAPGKEQAHSVRAEFMAKLVAWTLQAPKGIPPSVPRRSGTRPS